MPSSFDNTPIPAGFKRCSKCGAIKPATTEYFHARPGSKDGLRPDCKICVNTRKCLWYEANKEREKAKHRQYHAEHRELANAHRRLWHATHKEQASEYSRQWRKSHPEQKSIHQRNRRAKKHGARGTHTNTDLLAQYRRQKGKCYYCSHKMKPWGWKESCDLQPTEEHIVPVSRGGSNGPENLVIACRKCNEQKHTKLPHEWPEGGRLL